MKPVTCSYTSWNLTLLVSRLYMYAGDDDDDDDDERVNTYIYHMANSTNGRNEPRCDC